MGFSNLDLRDDIDRSLGERGFPGRMRGIEWTIGAKKMAPGQSTRRN
jgi:hypothetical protein